MTIFKRVQRVILDRIELDASIVEFHEHGIEIAEHPIESTDGLSSVVDYMRKAPMALRIDGIVSDTPTAFRLIGFPLGSSTSRTKDAYSALQQLMKQGTVFDVATSLARYSNMVLTTMSVVRDAERGNVLSATFGLREVQIAKTNTVNVSAQPQPQPKKNIQAASNPARNTQQNTGNKIPTTQNQPINHKVTTV